jgi:hypothetical protein
VRKQKKEIAREHSLPANCTRVESDAPSGTQFKHDKEPLTAHAPFRKTDPLHMGRTRKCTFEEGANKTAVFRPLEITQRDVPTVSSKECVFIVRRCDFTGNFRARLHDGWLVNSFSVKREMSNF